MKRVGLILNLVLIVTASYSWAGDEISGDLAPPASAYSISGLHTELVFNEAVAKAESLGGACTVREAKSRSGGKLARCYYKQCESDDATDPCETTSDQAKPFEIASQPVLGVALEAPNEHALLTRVVVQFDGDIAAVAQRLKQTYGEPTSDGTATDDLSWTHSRRISWGEGSHRMGLLNSPHLIILSANRTYKAESGGSNEMEK